jgi:hypothetical protein
MDACQWTFADGGRDATLEADGGSLDPLTAIRLARTLLDWGVRELPREEGS